MKFVVKRSEWVRGEGSTKSKLLRKLDGKKCCVGFFCLASGLTPDQILNVGTITETLRDIPGVKLEQDIWLNEAASAWAVTPWANAVYNANDNPRILDSTRERLLTKLFAEKGHEIVFED